MIIFRPCISHRHRCIFFAIECIRNKCDGTERYDFADKYHTSFPAFAALVTNIKTKVHFFKIGMEWNTDTPEFYMLKTEANQAHITGVVPKVEFCFPG